MKVRWTNESLRLRITPAELAAICAEKNVAVSLAFPGEGSWTTEIIAQGNESKIAFEQNSVRVYVSRKDVEKLNADDEEGIYFTASGPAMKYMIEKDFPCAHPRPAQALETPTETFTPPPGFEERKQKIRAESSVIPKPLS